MWTRESVRERERERAREGRTERAGNRDKIKVVFGREGFSGISVVFRDPFLMIRAGLVQEVHWFDDTTRLTCVCGHVGHLSPCKSLFPTLNLFFLLSFELSLQESQPVAFSLSW